MPGRYQGLPVRPSTHAGGVFKVRSGQASAAITALIMWIELLWACAQGWDGVETHLALLPNFP